MDLDLNGHVAIVTGAASGIGLACAQGLAREGCRVSLWDVDPAVEEQAAALAGEAGGSTMGVVVDVGALGAVEAAVRATEDELGAVAHLVHAAAVGSGKFGFPFSNLEPADWERVLHINIMGMVHVAHALAPRMIARRAGTMIYVGSIAGQIGSQTDPPYSASKAANINFAQCLAKDLAPHGVRVNIVNPGMVRTPLNRRVWQAWSELQAPGSRRTYEEWAEDKIRAVTPLGCWQEVEDVADMAVFLSSKRARQVTGQTINVDGGQVMHG
jgi:NAD(P)-dependent dehydrogenase (short-subunit alcohol dehydrogenase family)